MMTKVVVRMWNLDAVSITFAQVKNKVIRKIARLQ